MANAQLVGSLQFMHFPRGRFYWCKSTEAHRRIQITWCSTVVQTGPGIRWSCLLQNGSFAKISPIWNCSPSQTPLTLKWFRMNYSTLNLSSAEHTEMESTNYSMAWWLWEKGYCQQVPEGASDSYALACKHR